MFLAIVAYIVIGVVIGLIAKVFSGEELMSLVGAAGAAGAGGLIGGLLANLIADGGIVTSWAGVAGALIGSIVVILVVRVGRRRQGVEPEAGGSAEV